MLNQDPDGQSASCLNKINAVNAFRRLWFEHIIWTRSFIISTSAELGDLPYVTKRLLRNPSDFYNVLSKYYGDDNAKRFQNLLTDHLTIAAKLVNAAKAGDTETTNSERQKWYANANEIANFLAGINPFWSIREWQLMLSDHLKLTEQEAVERLSGQYEKDVALFDVITGQAMQMADTMANGIIRQFSI